MMNLCTSITIRFYGSARNVVANALRQLLELLRSARVDDATVSNYRFLRISCSEMIYYQFCHSSMINTILLQKIFCTYWIIM